MAQAPGEYVTDESASGTFTRDGIRATTSRVEVNVTNHGNLTAKTLPQPAESTLLYDSP